MPPSPARISTAIRAMLCLWEIGYRPLFRSAARQILQGRLCDPDAPEKGRWLEDDVNDYLRRVWLRAKELMPLANLETLPTWGNRHNVFLAVVTTAAYQMMTERGTSARYACSLVADMGWKIYSRMLKTAAIPARIGTRDPRHRIAATLRMLMIFPFGAPGRPGYAATAWTEGADTYTHWTHCPPLAFVRRLIEVHGDRGELEAFYRSWCLYDWPGADILAGDGRRGHYSRPHTMSRGDAVCDMVWHGRAAVDRKP